MRLRRLCCNPALIFEEEKKNKIIASSKLKVFGDTVIELIENRHKALVFSQFVDHLALLFSQFVDHLALLLDYLEKRKISF